MRGIEDARVGTQGKVRVGWEVLLSKLVKVRFLDYGLWY